MGAAADPNQRDRTQADGPSQLTGAEPRRGPRSGGQDIREDIISAARTVFGRDGYQRATIRSIADLAGVNTKLVHYYFGTKAELFSELFADAVDKLGLLDTLLLPKEPGISAGELYIRQVLTVIEERPEGEIYIGLFRSVGSHEESEQLLRTTMATLLAPYLPDEHPEVMARRYSLIGSQMVGLVLLRYILKPEAFTAMSIDQVARLIGPTLDHYLHADLPALDS